jgi:hypothetical protein
MALSSDWNTVHDLLKLKLTMVSGGQEGRAHVHFN